MCEDGLDLAQDCPLVLTGVPVIEGGAQRFQLLARDCIVAEACVGKRPEGVNDGRRNLDTHFVALVRRPRLPTPFLAKHTPRNRRSVAMTPARCGIAGNRRRSRGSVAAPLPQMCVSKFLQGLVVMMFSF